MTTIAELAAEIREFRDEREWAQFHSPANLAASVSIEAAELLEIFQWKSTEEVEALIKDDNGTKRISEELADVIIYCLLLADAAGIELNEAIRSKLAINAQKYPVEKSKGSAKKYTDYE